MDLFSNPRPPGLLVFLACMSLSCRMAKNPTETAVLASEGQNLHVETYVSGLEVPWSIVFTPDKRMLITERPGRIRVVENGRLRPAPLATLTNVSASGEGGLMGMTLHPRFATNHWLYVCYTTTSSQLMTKVTRFKETPAGLIDEKIIVDGIKASSVHNGCRIKFGPDQKLYITTGDAKIAADAQELSSLSGKTLRVNDDGSIPTDNPFVKTPKARPEIFSLGHRNSQGMDWQPGSGLMFQTEHGPSGFDGPGGGDEVNIVEPGKNYGWPLIHHKETRAGLQSPILEFTPAIAPAGAMFYTGSAFPKWQGNFFFTGLRGQRLVRVVLQGRKVESFENLFEGEYGRIRDIVMGPDGAIYFATSNKDGRGNPSPTDDRIMRMSPAK